jgi:hypothetical protein
MRVLDAHPYVLAWASESHRIPYFNPLTNRQTVYVPDFFMIYQDKTGQRHAEFIEIKPAGQVLGKAKSQQQKAQAIVNEAKWKAAKTFAEKQNVYSDLLAQVASEMRNNPADLNNFRSAQ